MNNTGKRVRQRVIFTEAFKKARVREYERGEMTPGQILRQYHISGTSLYKWIYKYSHYNQQNIKVVEMSSSSSEKIKQLEAENARLKQALGEKQLHLEYFEQISRLAKEHYDIDLEKNFGTRPSKP